MFKICTFFCPVFKTLIEHCCIVNPDSECVSGRPSIQPFFFLLSGQKYFMASSLRRTRVPQTNWDL